MEQSEKLPKDYRCSCGRNLQYPASINGKIVTCRCGKKYTK